MGSSNDDSEQTQLDEDKEDLVKDLQKRFPKRSRDVSPSLVLIPRYTHHFVIPF